ncbi:MAG: IS1 family transposase [Bacteroidetes bacterium]|nr:IS1 family transposase [Bacteroidota bacterium]
MSLKIQDKVKQVINGDICRYCFGPKIYKIEMGQRYKCYYCNQRYSVEVLEREYKLIKYLSNNYSIKKTARITHISYNTVAKYFTRFRSTIIDYVNSNADPLFEDILQKTSICNQNLECASISLIITEKTNRVFSFIVNYNEELIITDILQKNGLPYMIWRAEQYHSMKSFEVLKVENDEHCLEIFNYYENVSAVLRIFGSIQSNHLLGYFKYFELEETCRDSLELKNKILELHFNLNII